MALAHARRSTRVIPCGAAALLLGLLLPAASGDIFHLQRGGSVEGELIETTADGYKIRTVVGLIVLPLDDVERIEPSETPFADYEQRKQKLDDTAADHFKLAQWCAEQDLRGYERQHLKRALELDPDYAPARQALGYVRLNGMWVGGRHLDRRKAPPGKAASDEEEDAEKLLRAIQGRWLRHIRAVKRSLLESELERLRVKGRERLREIDDPLAIFPLVEVLSQGDVNDRAMLVDLLREFPEDESTMSLALMGLIDHNENIREAAVSELVQRDDKRVAAQYLDALRTGNDTIVLRAAYALGRFEHEDALPYLIDMLTAKRVKPVEVPVQDYFGVWPERFFGGSTGIRVGGVRGVRGIRGFGGLTLGQGAGVVGRYWEDIGRYYIAGQVRNVWRVQPVTVFRTQVLEALRAISGQNLGFDRDPWWRWYREKYGIAE